ncbi:MAG: IPT/TIG domain-containing protein [Candidatus Sungbacteria bacterium]|nr:IPT/TIG domain-containing protein [Candidatus Sungbacteria bacterium]
MNQKGFANIILIVLVVVLAGALGYVTLVKKLAPVEQPSTNNSQNTQTTTPPPSNNPASQNPPATQPPVTPPLSLPTTCVDQQEATPIITSISPQSGSVGTKVEIRGCNFTGFEGDLDAVFVRSDGKEIPVSGGNWYPGYGGGVGRGKIMIVTVQSYCESGSITGSYSGITSPCQTIKANPGVYKVYVTAWGKKSNTATFTVK